MLLVIIVVAVVVGVHGVVGADFLMIAVVAVGTGGVRVDVVVVAGMVVVVVVVQSNMRRSCEMVVRWL